MYFKKAAIFLAIIFFIGLIKAFSDPIVDYRKLIQIYNGSTGKFDYVHRLSSVSVTDLMGGTTISTRLDNLDLSTAALAVMISTNTSSIQGWDLFKTTGPAAIQGLTLFRSTAQTEIDALKLYRSTSQIRLDDIDSSTATITTALKSTATTMTTQFIAAFSSITTLQLATGTLSAQTTALALHAGNTNYVNLSGSTQTKAGGLNILGSVGIGTTAPVGKLTVVGANGRFSWDAPNMDASQSGITMGYGTTYNGTAMTNSGFMQAETQGTGYRNMLISPLGGNVGVGTDSPDTKLHIVPDTSYSSGWFRGISSTGTNVVENGHVAIGLHADKSINFMTKGLGDYTSLAWDRSVAMRIHDSGNIGMGTISPAQRFHIHSATFVVTSGGNVGIGTTNPTQRLHIADQTTNGSKVFLQSSRSSSGSNSQLSFYKTRGSISSQTTVITGDALGEVRFEAYEGSNIVQSASIIAAVDETPSSNSVPGRLTFRTAVSGNSATTERMRIDSAGNVGIGTTNPTAKLHLYETVASGGGAILDNTSSSGFSGHYVYNGGNLRGWLGYTGVDSGFGAPGTFQVGASTDMVFSTFDGPFFVERMRIKNNGNVGIGTTAPATTVDVKGNLHISSSGVTPDNSYPGNLRITKAPASGQYINLIREGTYGWALGTAYNSNTFAIGGAQATDSNFTSPYFAIDGGGNVGIGTTNPARKFVVAENVEGFSVETGYGSPHANMVRFGDNTGWKMHFGRSKESSGGATNTGTTGLLMTIQDNGNVGIGTTNPGAKLELYSSNESAAFEPVIRLKKRVNNPGYGSSDDGGAIEFYTKAEINESDYFQARIRGIDDVTDDSGWGGIAFDTYKNASITEALRITSSGNVGIGTTGPGNKLHVFGSDVIMQKNESSNVLGSYMQFTKTDATDRTWSLGATGSSSSPGDNMFALVDETASSAFRFLVDSNGNVAIGPTGPTTELYINKVTPEIGFGDSSYDPTAYHRIGVSSAASSPQYTFYRAQNATHDGSNWVHVVDGGFGGKAVRDYLYNGGWGVSVSTWTSHIVGWDEVLYINNGGGIQMPNLGAGTVTSDGSGNITSVSDERLKNITGKYKPGMKELKGIEPITYKWNEKSGLETDGEYVGFSAQNVKANLPGGTGIDSKGYLTLQDRAILAATVNALKEVQAELDALKKRLKKLEAKND